MYNIAKLLLETAKTKEERVKAVKQAIELGMPIDEIREYLDWLDATPERTEPNPTPPTSKA